MGAEARGSGDGASWPVVWPHSVAFLNMLNPTHCSALVLSEVKAVFLALGRPVFRRNGQKRCVRDTRAPSP